MSVEGEVREASAKFYAALNRMIQGDAGSMDDVWSHSHDVTTMHPIGGREAGRDEVGRSWEQVASIATGGEIVLDDQLIQVGGDMAFEVGIERGHATLAGEQVSIEQRVTNVYRKEGKTWKVVHHHTDLSPAMVEVVRR